MGEVETKEERRSRIDYTRETYRIVGRLEGKVDGLQCQACFDRLGKVETWQDRVTTVAIFLAKTTGLVSVAAAVINLYKFINHIP